MALYKRRNSWTVRIWYQGKKVEKAVGPDKKVAEAVQKELEKERALAEASGLPWTGLAKVRKARKSSTFAQVANEYLKTRESTAKASTLRTYRDTLRAHLLKEFGPLPVTHITRERIKAFQGKLSQGRSATRTNNVMNLLRAILRECFQEGLIVENPIEKVKWLREENPDIDPLTLEELQLALDYIDSFYRPVFVTLAWTGMRHNELRALRWKDIDWRRGEISISRGRVRGVESSTKTKSSKRVIQMHPLARAALEAVKDRWIVNLDGYIFTSKKGQPINQHIDVLWAKALKKAGIRHRPSYQLRHTWASMALEAGESAAWVASMLGHTSPATTFRHYARFIPSEKNGKLIGKVRTLGLQQTTAI